MSGTKEGEGNASPIFLLELQDKIKELIRINGELETNWNNTVKLEKESLTVKRKLAHDLRNAYTNLRLLKRPEIQIVSLNEYKRILNKIKFITEKINSNDQSLATYKENLKYFQDFIKMNLDRIESYKAQIDRMGKVIDLNESKTS